MKTFFISRESLGLHRSERFPSAILETVTSVTILCGAAVQKLPLRYILTLKDNPTNPADDVVFHPKHHHLYAGKEVITDYFEIDCKKFLKEAKIDITESHKLCSVPGVQYHCPQRYVCERVFTVNPLI